MNDVVHDAAEGANVSVNAHVMERLGMRFVRTLHAEGPSPDGPGRSRSASSSAADSGRPERPRSQGGTTGRGEVHRRALAAVEVQDEVLDTRRDEARSASVRGPPRSVTSTRNWAEISTSAVSRPTASPWRWITSSVTRTRRPEGATEVPAVSQLGDDAHADLDALDAEPDGHPLALQRAAGRCGRGGVGRAAHRGSRRRWSTSQSRRPARRRPPA